MPGITDEHANVKSSPLSPRKWMRRTVSAGFTLALKLCATEMPPPPDLGDNPDTHCLHFFTERV